MLKPDSQLISVDDHLIEPAHVWTSRLPRRYREDGPKVVEDEEGRQVWLYDGEIYPHLALNAVAGKPREEWNRDPVRYDQMRRGCFDPVERVKDLDLAGVQAQLCFPSFPGFAGTVFTRAKNKKLALECVRAYNDFMIDEWCAAAPNRFIPLIMLPLWDPLEAVDEIRRTAAKGAKAITFPESPTPLGLPSFHTDYWDPVFAAGEEANVPFCLHFGSSSTRPSTAPDAPRAVEISLMACNSMFAMSDLIFSPVFHKFPDIKIVMSEGGIGWIPYLLERLDYTWERHKYYIDIDRNARPSDLFRRNMWGCFIEDESGLQNLSKIGADRVMWELDYPHADSAWPEGRQHAEKQLSAIPDDVASLIVEENARRVFDFWEK